MELAVSLLDFLFWLFAEKCWLLLKLAFAFVSERLSTAQAKWIFFCMMKKG